MKIQGKTLEKSDVGRCVKYIPIHARGGTYSPGQALADKGHPDVENGRITSWNDVNVFVDYGRGSHPATAPADLIWG